MKKLFVFLMAACLYVTTAFAQDTSGSPFRLSSIGGGGFVSGNFSSWSVDENIPGDLHRYDETQLGVGPYVFINLKYLEMGIGLSLGQLNADKTMSENLNFPARTLSLRGSVYLKYPFTLSPRFSLFPLLGVDYDLYLLAKKSDDRDAQFPVSSGNQNATAFDALNTLWFKAGAGLDTFFNDHLFLRTELLYGLRLPNNMEKYLRDTRPDVDWMLEHGGDFKVAIGYRF